jgi:Uma2 family endonuclease
VEVADSSLEYDRDFKVPMYARSGVPELWILDLNERSVLVYRGPMANGYEVTFEARAGDLLVPEKVPGVILAIDDILLIDTGGRGPETV